VSNELQILTENAAGNGWIDVSPGNVSTGYQAQNINISDRSVGMDFSSARIDGNNVIVDISGPIDDNGVPFKITSQVTLTPPADNTYYICVIAGSTILERSLQLTTETPTWDAEKNALVDSSGKRVLNWAIYKAGGYLKIFRLSGNGADLGSTTNTFYPYGFITLEKIKYFGWPMVKQSFASPDTSPVGLTFDSSTGNLISCDSGTDTIYIHSGVSASVSSSFASPSVQPRGLAFDSLTGNLISCDDSTDLIYIHSGVSASISSSFFAPSTYPSGLTFDSSTGNLISCDDGTNRIYIHSGVSASISSSFASPGTIPSGLAFDSSTGNLISCDREGAGLIYIHSGVSASVLSSFAAPGTEPYGLTFDSSTGNLISCDSSTDTIYIHGF
jgi:DNA-binding beta-propeller fold protein YncE